MINLFTGTPGSGKSLCMAREIYRKLRSGGNVIANFDINLDVCKKTFLGEKKIGDFKYIANQELTVNALVEYAEEHHVPNKENQTLLCVDESQILFNSRSFDSKDRMDWITFFSQHRKLGYNVILVAQLDRMLDRQIRGLIENEYKFRKVNNYKIGVLFPFATFIMVQYWYGVREKIGSTIFFYSKKFGNLYNTFGLFKK